MDVSERKDKLQRHRCEREPQPASRLQQTQRIRQFHRPAAEAHTSSVYDDADNTIRGKSKPSWSD